MSHSSINFEAMIESAATPATSPATSKAPKGVKAELAAALARVAALEAALVAQPAKGKAAKVETVKTETTPELSACYKWANGTVEDRAAVVAQLKNLGHQPSRIEFLGLIAAMPFRPRGQRFSKKDDSPEVTAELNAKRAAFKANFNKIAAMVGVEKRYA